MGASSGILTLNGRDVDDLSLEIVDLGDPYGGLSYDRAQARAFGVAGGWPAGEATVEPRVLTFALVGSGTTSTRRGILDDLRRHLKGVVEVVLEDDSTRALYGRVEFSQGGYRFPETAWVGSGTGARTTIQITCYNPLWQDLYPEIVAFGATRVPCPLGTAPSAPTVKIMGSATDPELIYRGIAGAELESMDFNGLTLASDEYLEIDMRLKTVTKYDSGSASNSLSDLDSGWFFSLDPGDGDRGGTAWPTLEVDAGTAVAEYRKMWE